MAMASIGAARQLISGLLALTMLLFAGTDAVARESASYHERIATLTAQSVVVADCGVATCQGDCDHGFPCCPGAQCAAHAGWLQARSYELPTPLPRVVAPSGLGESSVSGLSTEPLSPPPRTAV
jgi:hypothetical protein